MPIPLPTASQLTHLRPQYLINSFMWGAAADGCLGHTEHDRGAICYPVFKPTSGSNLRAWPPTKGEKADRVPTFPTTHSSP